uniref:RING-type domain-containing protein n=1 Tax=Anopheles farauti TaxID=69004 RepID=A0A182Q7P3_9DIPT
MTPHRWIHCGLCFRLEAKKDIKFFHLSCLDVLCRACMAKTNRGTVCPVCKAPIRKFTELDDTMSKREKVLYHPGPYEFYHIASQTLLFQQKHKHNLIKAILEARHSLHRLNELESQIREKVVETQRRYENLRTFRRNLQENIRKSLSSIGASQQISQRRMSACTSSLQTKPCAVLLRRYSIDAFNSAKSSQASSMNDSGISVTTPSNSVK